MEDSGATDDEHPVTPVVVRNVTPHPVTLVAGGRSVDLPAADAAARVEVTSEPVGTLSISVGDGPPVQVPLVREVHGRLRDLPPERGGVVLLTSRLVHDAAPDRSDLACPTDLVRDDAGRVVAAQGLVVAPARDRPAPDHLVVLAGGNPLPNLQAVMTLEPRRVTVVASKESTDAARRLRSAMRALEWSPQVEVLVVRDANRARSVTAALESLEPGWALSYTGGTKVMAAQARLAYERWGDRRNAHASVVDGAVVRDDGEHIDLSDTGLTLDAMAALHGHRLVRPRTAPTLRSIVRAGPALHERMADPSEARATDCPPSGVAPRLRRALSQTGGRWLEEVAGAAFGDCHDQVVMNPRLHLDRRAEDPPELDVVARSGWKVIVVSCTIERKRATRKVKLLEAMTRARQLSGDRATAALVCLGSPAECRSLADDVARGPVDVAPVVYGRADVERWIDGDAVLTGTRSGAL